ncbi:hypothetical protein GOODEAATRI_002095 [Goodea atripinnis]|uniref:UBC core domain-containing protein n=1 Tax=Goodea atripinnis TaxID=208336 RepID=A0ABV0P0W7_9TELE
MLEMKSLQEEPVEGFKITLVDEADLYNWEVAIFGPPNTHYEGGYFKVPTTLAEYCVRTRAPAPDEGSDLFYDYYYDDDDVEGEDGDCCYDEDDSGNEES